MNPFDVARRTGAPNASEPLRRLRKSGWGSIGDTLNSDADSVAISIGPNSDCDAVILRSDSMGAGDIIVSVDAPYVGYVKHPFQVIPFYVVDDTQIPVGAPTALYTVDVVCWFQLPPFIPRKRPPQLVASIGAAASPSLFVARAMGRKTLRWFLHHDAADVAGSTLRFGSWTFIQTTPGGTITFANNTGFNSVGLTDMVIAAGSDAEGTLNLRLDGSQAIVEYPVNIRPHYFTIRASGYTAAHPPTMQFTLWDD